MTERLKTLLFPLREGTTINKYQVPRKKSYKSRIRRCVANAKYSNHR
jgi:hypothetical protein